MILVRSIVVLLRNIFVSRIKKKSNTCLHIVSCKICYENHEKYIILSDGDKLSVKDRNKNRNEVEDADGDEKNNGMRMKLGRQDKELYKHIINRKYEHPENKQFFYNHTNNCPVWESKAQYAGR